MSSRLGIRSKSDDNESVAGSVASLLDCYGHHAAVACDGESALRPLRIGAFEITFIDENLPDIKGSADARSLKETPNRSAAYLQALAAKQRARIVKSRETR
jgi:CheY-like chemotaxis protein